MHEENHARSIVKALSWRAVGTIDTMIISLIITRKLAWALSIGFIELFTKMFLYYLHERAWNRVKFGKGPAQAQDYNI